MNDLDFLVGFHEAWLFPHFKFFQSGDSKAGKTPGFMSREILVRYYLMLEDLNKMDEDSWRNHEKFQTYKNSFDILNDNE